MGGQFAWYATIGVLINGALYAVYLGLSSSGAAPLTAMTVAYLVGVALSFALNGRITFVGRTADRSALIRFLGAYALGYLFNATGLYLAVEGLRVPHYWAQLFLIGATAVFLFTLQRWWVFKGDLAERGG